MSTIFKVITILLSTLLWCAYGQQLPVCAKIDFNRSNITQFRSCYEQYLPVLGSKEYVQHPEIRPYRNTSRFFLSPKIEGASCVESEANFRLDEHSIIQAAIYVDYEDSGAFVTIIVVDLVENDEAYSWKYEQPAGWFMVEEKITKKLDQAMVCIYSFIWHC